MPLYAGAYWWTVRSHDRDTFRDYYSAPSPFSVAATARVITIGSQRLTYIHVLHLTVRWQTNAKTQRVSVSIYRGQRRLWTTGRTEETLIQGEADETEFQWQRSRGVKRGAKLRVVATVRALDAKATKTRTVLAP